MWIAPHQFTDDFDNEIVSPRFGIDAFCACPTKRRTDAIDHHNIATGERHGSLPD
jgi:hypothetical protein